MARQDLRPAKVAHRTDLDYALSGLNLCVWCRDPGLRPGLSHVALSGPDTDIVSETAGAATLPSNTAELSIVSGKGLANVAPFG